MTEFYTSLEKLGIPGPKPVWVFGNVLEFKGKVRTTVYSFIYFLNFKKVNLTAKLSVKNVLHDTPRCMQLFF